MLRENKHIYRIFCELFVQGVSGNTSFRNGCCTEPLTKWCTISDEAMTFLILANNWGTWREMSDSVKNPGDKMKKCSDCTTKQLYFTEQKGRGYSWKDEGKRYYNKQYQSVVEDRQSNGEKFDEYFMEKMNNESEVGKRLAQIGKKKGKVEVKEAIGCYNDVPEGFVPTQRNINGGVRRVPQFSVERIRNSTAPLRVEMTRIASNEAQTARLDTEDDCANRQAEHQAQCLGASKYALA